MIGAGIKVVLFFDGFHAPLEIGAEHFRVELADADKFDCDPPPLLSVPQDNFDADPIPLEKQGTVVAYSFPEGERLKLLSANS